MALPDLAAWRVESLRLTVFFSVPVSAAGRGWWTRITGEVPETTVNRQQLGEYSESGTFLGGQLEMKVAFNRLDWTLVYPFAGMPGSPQPELISTLSAKLLNAARGLLADLGNPVLRVAYGAVAFHKTDDVFEGNNLVAELLPFMSFESPKKSKDLVIQINCPCESRAIPGLEINRIARLAVMTRQMVIVGPAGIPTVEMDEAVRAEYDMSTSGENTEMLSVEALSPLFFELAEASERFLESGVSS